MSGGTRRNLEWRPHLRTAAGVTEDDLLFLADAQTSGVCSSSASCPGHPVIGHTVPGGGREVR